MINTAEKSMGSRQRRGRPKLQREDSLERSGEGCLNSHECVTFPEEREEWKELTREAQEATNVT